MLQPATYSERYAACAARCELSIVTGIEQMGPMDGPVSTLRRYEADLALCSHCSVTANQCTCKQRNRLYGAHPLSPTHTSRRGVAAGLLRSPQSTAEVELHPQSQTIARSCSRGLSRVPESTAQHATSSADEEHTDGPFQVNTAESLDGRALADAQAAHQAISKGHNLSNH
jgi:hypothetical protein